MLFGAIMLTVICVVSDAMDKLEQKKELKKAEEKAMKYILVNEKRNIHNKNFKNKLRD